MRGNRITESGLNRLIDYLEIFLKKMQKSCVQELWLSDNNFCPESLEDSTISRISESIDLYIKIKLLPQGLEMNRFGCLYNSKSYSIDCFLPDFMSTEQIRQHQGFHHPDSEIIFPVVRRNNSTQESSLGDVCPDKKTEYLVNNVSLAANFASDTKLFCRLYLKSH